jgi:intraflagellar transport protein 172
LVAQANDYETQNDYDKAAACYLKVAAPLTSDTELMERCWTKAGELAIKFLPEEVAQGVVMQAAHQLNDIGRYMPVRCW